MARYLGIVQGARGEATRLGHASSGLRACANGWHLGGEVRIEPDATDESKDRVSFYVTSGSGHEGTRAFVASFTRDELATYLAKRNASAPVLS